ncbi:MAG: VWA domain-containing protein [Armatimonadota bacterium]
MQFAHPWILLAIPVVIYLGFRQVRPGAAGSASLVYPDLGLLRNRIRSLRATAAKSLPVFRTAAMILLVIGLARPQMPTGVRQVEGAGIDIVLTLDISGSMLAEDFKPKNRFHVAREVLADFIKRAGPNRLGLVVFSGQAFTQAPLTSDHEMVSKLLEQVDMNMLEDGTAIGMAIATAANRLRNSKAKSKVIILLTDGENNRGEIDPVTAARAANTLGIRIYAIGVGKPGGAPVPNPNQGLGQPQYIRGPDGQPLLTKLDEETLQEVAGQSGEYFRATDAGALRAIYRQIDEMEKSEYLGSPQMEYKQLFGKFVWPALIILVAVFALNCTLLRKVP